MTTINAQEPKKTNWLWIGLGAAALFCLCAVAVAVFLFYRVGQSVKEGVKTDPESAAKAAHEIADYDLPAGYREQMSMNIMIYSFVVIGPDSSPSSSIDRPIIMLAQFQAGVDQQQMEQQLRQSFEQQSGRRGMNMKLAEVKKMTIRGTETDVATYEGTDENGNSFRELIAAFPGKNGAAMLLVMGDAQSWDQPLVDDFIRSIR